MAAPILITGGAGYLGRIFSEVLRRKGGTPFVVDNFATSRRFESDVPFRWAEVDLADEKRVREVAREAGKLDGAIHFAAKALVSESHQMPEVYYRNNLLSTLNTALWCVEQKIPALIHSSSCAVYGIPDRLPIREDAPQRPISPYGETKRMGEEILNSMAKSHGLRVLHLRYFNPGGAIDGVPGEAHEPETHLIPNVLKSALQGKTLDIFGDDYDTPDGTCQRDFLHVEDLAEAHLKALEFVREQPAGYCGAINLGAGRGISVREVISACEKLLGKPIAAQVRPRRPGDPARLFADTALAEKLLGWRPKRSLDDILSSHLRWERTRLK